MVTLQCYSTSKYLLIFPCIVELCYMYHLFVSPPTELLTDEAQAEVQTFYEDLGGLALEKK